MPVCARVVLRCDEEGCERTQEAEFEVHGTGTSSVELNLLLPKELPNGWWADIRDVSVLRCACPDHCKNHYGI